MRTILEDTPVDEYLKSFKKVLTELEYEHFLSIYESFFQGKPDREKIAFLGSLRRLTSPLNVRVGERVKLAFLEYCNKMNKIKKEPKTLKRISKQRAEHKNYKIVIVAILSEYMELCNIRVNPFLEEFVC